MCDVAHIPKNGHVTNCTRATHKTQRVRADSEGAGYCGHGKSCFPQFGTLEGTKTGDCFDGIDWTLNCAPPFLCANTKDNYGTFDVLEIVMCLCGLKDDEFRCEVVG